MYEKLQKMRVERARKAKTGKERGIGSHLYICSDTFY